MISTEKPGTSLSAATCGDRLRSPRQRPDSPISPSETGAPGSALKDAHFTGSAEAPRAPSLKVGTVGGLSLLRPGRTFDDRPVPVPCLPAKGFQRTTGGCDDADFEVVSPLRR